MKLYIEQKEFKEKIWNHFKFGQRILEGGSKWWGKEAFVDIWTVKSKMQVKQCVQFG